MLIVLSLFAHFYIIDRRMAPNKSEIGLRVREEAESFHLHPPRSIVMVTHMSLNMHTPGSYGKSLLRDGYSKAETPLLATEIIKEELRQMFPWAPVSVKEVDFAKYDHRKTQEIIHGADVIMASPYPMDIGIFNQIRNDNPEKPMIAGGPFVTRNPHLFHELTDGCCMAVLGRVEGSMPSVLQLIEDKGYKGKTIRRKDRFDASRDYHILPREGVVSNIRTSPTGVLFEAGEGCDEVCNFCAVLSHVKSDRNPKEAMEELERLYKQGIRYIFFTDNDLSRRSPELLESVFSYVSEKNIGWVGEGSRKILEYPELARLMGKTNILFLHGIDDIFANVSTTEQFKSRTPEQIKADLEAFLQYGFLVFGSGIVGLDDHRFPDTFVDMSRFLELLDVPTTVHMVLPFPGTQLYTTLDKAGRIIKKDLSHYTYGEVVYKPLYMTEDQLTEGLRWLQREMADPRRIADMIGAIVQKVGVDKFRRFPRAIASLVMVAVDNGLVGMKTHPEEILQRESKSILNKIWGMLPHKLQDVVDQNAAGKSF